MNAVLKDSGFNGFGYKARTDLSSCPVLLMEIWTQQCLTFKVEMTKLPWQDIVEGHQRLREIRKWEELHYMQTVYQYSDYIPHESPEYNPFTKLLRITYTWEVPATLQVLCYVTLL